MIKTKPKRVRLRSLLTKVELAHQAPDNTCGYQMKLWPADVPQPSEVYIQAARALKAHLPVTKQELAVATYLSVYPQVVNPYEIGRAIAAVMGGKPDHKLNCVNKRKNVITAIKVKQAKKSEGMTSIFYGAALTDEGRAKVVARFNELKLKVPTNLIIKGD